LLIRAEEDAVAQATPPPPSSKVNHRFPSNVSKLLYREVTRMSEGGLLIFSTGLCRR
jgi:hypothetical protein